MIMSKFWLFLFVSFSTSYSFTISFNYLRRQIKSTLPHPIILIPGDGGSQAYAQFKQQDSDPFQIWVDLRYIISPRTFSQYFKLKYNNTTRRTEDNDDVVITFPGWGETWPVENLDSRPHSVTKYFQDLTTVLKQNSYYVSNYTIRGAPYDFRKATNENEDFNTKLKFLIEETFSNGGNRGVVLLAHSMGSLYALHFLNSQTDSWKRQFIKAFVSISAPLGGSMKALKIEISGDNFGIYFDNALYYREMQRSMPSLSFLLPDPRLWSKDEVVVFTPTKNYTAHDYKELFNDIGFPEGFEMYKDSKATIDGLVRPTGVAEVYCIYGFAVSTPAALIYKTFPDAQPTVINEADGDGTVNMRSLTSCRSWKIEPQAIKGADHVAILSNSDFAQQVKKIANADQFLPREESFWHSLLRSRRDRQ